MIHYLGPSVGQIPLGTWDELLSAAGGGSLEETQWVELKQQLRPSDRDGNIELARDLASLSLYGGVLVIGVTDKTFEVVGCDISGMADRISQVAAMRVEPPLSPVIYPAIQHPEDESKHVLVVEVPASPHAPHMVDGSYWARSSNGKRKLSDAEVRPLMQARTSNESAFRERLLAMVHQDPLAQVIEGHPTGNGHIFLLAEPCAPVLGRTADFVLMDVVRGLFDNENSLGTMSDLTCHVRDPRGLALSSTRALNGGDDLVKREWEDSTCVLLCIDDDSSLEFVSGGGTMYRLGRGYRDQEPFEVVGSSAIVRSTWQLYRLIERLSLGHWGYKGPWRVGIHVTNLQGKLLTMSDLRRSGMVFPRASFTNTMVTSPASWPQGPEPEARKLLAGFLRAIGREGANLAQVQL